MSRPKIAAGNWKMNLLSQAAGELCERVVGTTIPQGVDVVLAVPSVHIGLAVAAARDNEHVHIAAQNCHQAASGAYTGELSAAMLKDAGCDFVVLGHSERRQYFGEDDGLLAEKTTAALAQGLKVIFCVGEPLEVRQSGGQVDYVCKQVERGLFHLDAAQMSMVTLAYEPIWAIGTGETASPQQAQEMHAAIRSLVADQYDGKVADNLAILYGGSVKPANAKEIFSQSDVDGGLVGGASLKADSFKDIILSF